MLMQVRSGFMMGGKSVPIPATFFDSGTSADSANVSMPAGIASGDLGLLFDCGVSATTPPADITPAGWTLMGTTQTATGGGVGARWNMSYRVLDGTETTLTGINGIFSSKLVLVFRKLATLTWGAPASVQTDADVLGGLTDKTVTVGAAPLIMIGALADGGSGVNLLMTPAQTATVVGTLGGSTRCQAGYIVYGVGGANNTISSDNYGGTVAIGGFYIPLT